mgnify:CR=1 FL=1
MHWNYRLIDLSHENAGDPWLDVKEVYYDDDESLQGYADVSLGSEDVDGLRETLTRMLEALDKPVLKIEDFKGENK